MLRVREIENTIYIENIEIDKHIPFNIEWNYTSNKNPKNYWRTGNFKQSLFAIGLDSVTGIIRDMTLTNSNTISINESDISTRYTVLGVPIFDLTNWPCDGFLDYSKDFSVHLMKNGLSICMVQDHVEVIVKSERVLFHIGKDNILIGIDLIDITKEEHHKLQMSLG